jgi:hypothetical protein
MSFEQYSSFQNQPGPQDGVNAGPGGPPQQDNSMQGQQMDNSPVAFPGNPGEPGSAGGQPGGDAKTTLW